MNTADGLPAEAEYGIIYCSYTVLTLLVCKDSLTWTGFASVTEVGTAKTFQ